MPSNTHVHSSTSYHDEDDGWQVVSSTRDISPTVSSKTSTSSSPQAQKQQQQQEQEQEPSISSATTAATTSSAPSKVIEPSVTSNTSEFKEKPQKSKKKQIFGTDEFQPVVSKKQIAHANRIATAHRSNNSVGISTSSYFDLLQDTEDAEDVTDIIDRIQREEEEERERRLLQQEKENELEQEKEQQRLQNDKHEQEKKIRREAEIRSQQEAAAAAALVLKQQEEREEQEKQVAKELAEKARQEADRIKAEEEEAEAAKAAVAEAQQKKKKEEKKQQQKKEKREKELKEQEEAEAKVAKAQKEAEAESELNAQAALKDIQSNIANALEEPIETTVESASPSAQAASNDDSWEVEEDVDEWQQQSRSKKGRKTRGSQVDQESSISAVSSLQSQMPIYLLEQDEIADQDSDEEEEEEVSEEEQQRREEEKAKAAAKAKAKAASNKKNKKKNANSNSNSNSAVNSPHLEGKKKAASNSSSVVNSPRLEGKKSKKNAGTAKATTPLAATVVDQKVEPAETEEAKLKKVAFEESSSREPEVAAVQESAEGSASLTTESGRSGMVDKDGPSDLVGGTITSIFEKGVNPGLIKMMNLIFVCLFLSLGFLIFASGGNGHVIALTGIAVALFITVQWFLREMETMKIDERKNV